MQDDTGRCYFRFPILSKDLPLSPRRHIAAACVLLAGASLFAGCGGSSSADTATIERAAAGANPAIDCPNKASTTQTLTVRNDLDIPVRIASGSAGGVHKTICYWFSQTGNPTSYNGTVIAPNGTQTMRLEMRALGADWRMAFGTGVDQTIGAAVVELGLFHSGSAPTTGGPVESELPEIESADRVRFRAPEGWVTRRPLGQVREGASWRDVALVGGWGASFEGYRHTLTIAYNRP